MPGMGGGEGGSTRERALASAFHHALFHDWLIVAAVLVALVVAWNLFRLRQLTVRAKTPRVSPVSSHPIAQEPAGRRLLRVSFGLLWLFDGLLQSQAAMPMRLANEVIRPVAFASPDWVRSLVGAGVNIWNRHPVTAANSALWIEIGIALFMLSASRGFLSRLAGLAGALWGAVVWILGESFGGLFAPGYSWLFGAPGAALLYIVAGLVLVLPDRAWISPRLGLEILRSLGALLLVMGVIQAWPGRGFWRARAGGTGTLAAMLMTMSRISQPKVLSSLLAGAARFGTHHSWGLNLFAVLVLAICGTAFFFVSVRGGRARMLFGFVPVLPVVIGFIAVCLVDWIVVEDLGVFGGLGTDPNSMLPLSFLVITGYLAMTRATGIAPIDTGAAPRRFWSSIRSIPGFIDEHPAHSLRSFVALGALFVIIYGSVPMLLVVINPGTSAANARPPVGSVAMSPVVAEGFSSAHWRPQSAEQITDGFTTHPAPQRI